MSGTASAAYENCALFVLSSPFATAGTLYAYDANAGNQKWATSLGGQWSFTAGITALNGMVYTGAAGSGGTLYAVNESTGVLVWTQEVMNGDSSTPAVTETGIYVSYPCQTYDFDPGSSSQLWNANNGCEGGGGATPVVANGSVYSPDSSGGTFNGDIFDAASGVLKGSYVADVPPAIAAQNGYFLQSGTLRALTLSSNTVLWSFTGDGMLDTAPIAVNSYVFIGSSSGECLWPRRRHRQCALAGECRRRSSGNRRGGWVIASRRPGCGRRTAGDSGREYGHRLRLVHEPIGSTATRVLVRQNAHGVLKSSVWRPMRQRAGVTLPLARSFGMARHHIRIANEAPADARHPAARGRAWKGLGSVLS